MCQFYLPGWLGLRQPYYLESYTLSVVMVDPWDTVAYQCTHVCAHYIGLGQHHHTVFDLLLRPPTLHDDPLRYVHELRLLNYGMTTNERMAMAMTDADQCSPMP